MSALKPLYAKLAVVWGGPVPSANMSKVPPGGHCESDDASADDLGDG